MSETTYKSSEMLHKQIDIYLKTLKYGKIEIIKHEDKITVDVHNRNRVYINQGEKNGD